MAKKKRARFDVGGVMLPQPFKIRRLGHFGLNVPDPKACLDFYCEGLGFRILKFSRFLQTPRIWVYLLVLGIIGLALDFGFRAVNRRLFFWSDTRAT